MNKTNFQFIKKAVKCIPFIVTVAAVAHWILKLNGYQSKILEFLIGSGITPLLFYFLVSSLFNMCAIHKMHICYASLAVIFMDLERMIDFGPALPYIRNAIVLAGIIVVVITLCLYKRWIHKEVSISSAFREHLTH